jgi:hypothetical protein
MGRWDDGKGGLAHREGVALLNKWTQNAVTVELRRKARTVVPGCCFGLNPTPVHKRWTTELMARIKIVTEPCRLVLKSSFQ